MKEKTEERNYYKSCYVFIETFVKLCSSNVIVVTVNFLLL